MEKDRQAPADKIWVCMHCGKTSEDRFGIEGNHSPEWTETCTLNAKLYFKSMLKFREGTNEVEEITLPSAPEKKKEPVAPRIRKVAK